MRNEKSRTLYAEIPLKNEKSRTLNSGLIYPRSEYFYPYLKGLI